MPDEKSMASGTIFDEIGYDEMQKTENHEIGFKLFRIMFFVVLAFVMAMIIICSDAQNVAGTAVSVVFFGIVMLFYVLYAFMTAKKGIMNPKFAKSWSAKWVIISYIALALLWTFKLINHINVGAELWDYAFCIVWIIMCTESILMSLCARKNNRVVKEQLADEDKE